MMLSHIKRIPQQFRLIFTVICVAFLFGNGCRDKGTRPVPVTQDTRFFFADVNTDGSIFEFSLPSFSLDSFILPFEISDLSVTPEGKELIISAGRGFNGPDSTVLYDIETGQLSHFWPEAKGFEFSPDGSMIAIGGKPFTILDRATLTPIFFDTSLSLYARFSANSKELIGFTVSSNSSEIITIDIENGFRITRHEVGPTLMDVFPSPIDSLVYIMKFLSQCTWSFEVYDLIADSIIFTTRIQPGFGKIAGTPDNKYVFFTRHGQIIGIGCPEDPAVISVYDVESNNIVKDIPVRTYIPVGRDSVLVDVPVSDIRVSVNGKWLVGLGLPQTSFVVVIDVSTLSVVHYEFTSRTKHLAFLATSGS